MEVALAIVRVLIGLLPIARYILRDDGLDMNEKGRSHT